MMRKATDPPMYHSFNAETAKEVGVNAAIILGHLEFFMRHNADNDRNFRDGRYWTYESRKSMAKRYPYLSDKQIRTALKRLEDGGYIVSGCYNKTAYDRTKWYSVTDRGLSALGATYIEPDEEGPLPKVNIECAERAKAHMPKGPMTMCQKGQPIPGTVTGTVTSGSVEGECSSQLVAGESEHTHDAKTFLHDSIGEPVPFSDSPRPSVADVPEWRRPCEPPTPEEVATYAETIGYASLDAERFCDHYASVGWMKNGSPVTDWRALVRTWKLRDDSDPKRLAERKAAKKAERYGADNMPPVPDVLAMDPDRAWDWYMAQKKDGGELQVVLDNFAPLETEAHDRYYRLASREWCRLLLRQAENGLSPSTNPDKVNFGMEPRWIADGGDSYELRYQLSRFPDLKEEAR